MKVSVVVAALNEADSLPELVGRVRKMLTDLGVTWEMVVIDDGSTDGTYDTLRQLSDQIPELRFRSFARNYGKSAALAVAFEDAKGDIVVTMDGDLQDDPDEVPKLIAKLEEGWDVVSGWKKVRKDPLSKTVPSKLFNSVTSWVAGIRLHDFNCGLKAYRGYVAQGLPVYGELHRFLPALAYWQGFRVTEEVVLHHPRKYGTSKFGPNRFINGFLDLLTVTFVYSGRHSPLHFFGRVGLFLGLVGGSIFGGFVISWILKNPIHMRPLFFIGLILIILAIQFISLGLLGELVVKGQQSRAVYRFRQGK